MALTRTTADAALKEDYQPSVREQLNNEIMMLAQVESRSNDVEGREAVLSLHTGRNSGIGPRTEGATLPTAGSQAYTTQRVQLKYNYGRIQINGPVIRDMKSDVGSFVRAIESETRGIVDDLKREVNWQVFSGQTGVIAQCDTTSSATEVQLQASTDSAAMRRLEVGMLVDIGTLADPDSIASGRTITAVEDIYGDDSNQSITISGAAVTTSSSHYISLSGSRPDSATGYNGLTGLQYIVGSGDTLFGIDGSSVAVWNSTVDENGGSNRSFTDNLVERVIDKVWLACGKAPNFIVTSPAARRNYAAQLKSLKRFTDTVDLKGGFSALTVSAGNTTLPIAVDRDCPDNTAFVLNLDHIVQHQNSDWEFMDEDGAVLNRVANVDAYEATLFKYHELTTDARNTHAVIQDLSES